jgi:hypothetical protein
VGRVYRRAALVLALLGVVAPGPVLPAPPDTGTTSPVISTALLPLSGVVGDVSLTGVVHVVTQVQIPTDPCSGCPTGLTVHANLPAGDVTAVGAEGVACLAHGAGMATEEYDNITLPTPPPIVPGFFLMALGANRTAPTDPCEPGAFAVRLDLSFALDGVLNPEGSSATPVTCGDICPGP